MKPKHNFLSAIILFVLIGLSSCHDDAQTNQVSKTDAKTALADFNTTAVNDLQKLSSENGMHAIQDLYDLVEVDNPFGRIGTDKKKIRAFFQDKGREFKSIFVPAKAITNGRTSSVEQFDFETKKGVYGWNPTLGLFERTGDSDIIQINFHTEGSTTNNAELRLTAYSEIEFYDEEWSEYNYQPTLLKTKLLVNETQVASLDLEAQWDDVGFPVAVDILLNVNNFILDISFDSNGSTSSKLDLSLLHGTETIVASSITVHYAYSSKSEESLKSMQGFVQLKNLKLQGLSLYSEDKKMGDIVFVEEDSEYVPYLQYTDGSKEKLETILQPVIDEIDNLSVELGIGG